MNQGPNINTAAEEFHFTQDVDGQVYFTSNRPGGFGSMDIYGAASAGPNNWGPLLISDPRSTLAGADMRPALPPGGETMAWFSSRQDSSFGNADIF